MPEWPFMLFGDPTRFAIEAQVASGLKQPSAVWGRMCIRLPSATIGDFADDYCALYPACRRLAELEEMSRQNWHPEFDGCTDHDIHTRLYNALWAENDDEYRHEYNRYYFMDSQTGEQFNGFMSYVVARPCSDLKILFQLRDNTRGATTVNSALFRNTIHEFRSWFDSEFARLQNAEA